MAVFSYNCFKDPAILSQDWKALAILVGFLTEFSYNSGQHSQRLQMMIFGMKDCLKINNIFTQP